ncbi:MAG: dephospho-CoA kinase [Bdellovibrionales bacterium]|nr:dephospho-CoA kinase [Bdellovibrionales bacterium]NQZ19185.1 dephospho-CoA kinase [Bdellovibrionales bacterium]
MNWIGLTGGIASGKTTVSNMLREQAVPIIDADQMAHLALKVHHDKIVSYFGSGILDEKGVIDRRKLGEKVFSNEKQRKLLEGIVHPFVQGKVAEKRRLLESAGHKWAVYDVPLLFESQLEKDFDLILFIYAPREVCIERMIERNGLTKEEAEKRMDAQLDVEVKKTKAHDVIENIGDIDDLRDKVKAWKQATDEKYS